jgi:hypothetical protein
MEVEGKKMAKLNLDVVNKENTVVKVDTIKEALEIGIPDYYVIGWEYTVWTPCFIYTSESLEDMVFQLRHYEKDQEFLNSLGDIYLYPATEKLKERCLNDDTYIKNFQERYPGFHPNIAYSVNEDGRADFDEEESAIDENFVQQLRAFFRYGYEDGDDTSGRDELYDEKLHLYISTVINEEGKIVKANTIGEALEISACDVYAISCKSSIEGYYCAFTYGSIFHVNHILKHIEKHPSVLKAGADLFVHPITHDLAEILTYGDEGDDFYYTLNEDMRGDLAEIPDSISGEATQSYLSILQEEEI